MRQYKKWLLVSCLLLTIILVIISALNYIANPLWCFNHDFKISEYKNQYNEREQKTNLLYFGKKQYDGILIGSSRSSYINTNNSKKYNLFNYSIASLHINEYKGYIDIANKIDSKNTQNIILGLDFFSYLKDSHISKMPSEFYKDISSPFYRFKSLLSYDSLRKAKKNLQIKEDTKERVYTNDYVVYTTIRDENETKKTIAEKINHFSKKFYDKQNKFLNYTKILHEIKSAYPQTNFIIITTPITKDLFIELKNHNLYTEYENWIEDLVSIFGEIHHFMYLNKITKNSYKNFYDGHHFYPYVGDLIINQIDNRNNDDFGLIINKSNLKKSIKKLRKINNAI